MSRPGTGTSSSEKGFPTTHWTRIRDASDPASPGYRESLEHLAGTYWRPVYAHFRRKWGKSHEEAKDLTQEFFAALCEKDFLKRLSPEHGRFRSYVMAALDNFARLQRRAESRLKRGGGAIRVPIDVIEPFEPSREEPPERAFLREGPGRPPAEQFSIQEKELGKTV